MMLSRFVASQLKHNSYFLLGASLGLCIALVAVPLDDAEADASESEGAVVCEPPAGGAALAGGGDGGADEWEPRHERRPLAGGGAAGGGASGARGVQRPRYYSTELGMRGALLAAALTGEAALAAGGRATALNRTAARLQPALRLFMAARAPRAPAPPLANVVGFTDTREMLKPFHTLKYLADNYLEEYDFFFLVSDVAFVNARRLTELVAKLSVSQDIYMGVPADEDSQYCSLDAGVVLSNSVVRAVYGELDWCVRNSYSPHHHENVGRCVLHAAHVPCRARVQGQQYRGARVKARASEGEGVGEGEGEGEGARVVGVELTPELADAVTVYPLDDAADFYRIHAYVSRVQLERARSRVRRLRACTWRGARRGPRGPAGARRGTWPGGLRAEPGLAPPPPASRFDHLRWARSNGSHALAPAADDRRAVAPLAAAARAALAAVWARARAWALRHWAAHGAELVEAAWRWEPPVALRYRLLLRLDHRVDGGGRSAYSLRLVEAAHVLGAARLVPVPYVTESARLTLVLPVPVPVPVTSPAPVTSHAHDALAFLRRYDAVALQRDRNTALLLVFVRLDDGEPNEQGERGDALEAEVRREVAALLLKHRDARIELLEARLRRPEGEAEGEESAWEGEEAAERAARAALEAALARAPRDALLLLMAAHADFNDDFLNRVRMNTIAGEQWFLPVPFARFAQYDHPRFVEADGSKPQVGTGRFNTRHRLVLAVHRADYEAALSGAGGAGAASGATSGAASGAAHVLVRGAPALRCVRAPEPGLVLAARPPPCRSPSLSLSLAPACLRRERADGPFAALDLGARHSLAKLLLQEQAGLG